MAKNPAGDNGKRNGEAVWAKVKDEYITGEKTFLDLAGEYSVSHSTLSKRAARELWASQRKFFRKKTATDTIEKSSEAASDRRAKNQRALDLRMDGSALSLLRKSVNAETAAQSKDYAIAFGIVMDKRFQELRGGVAGPQIGTDVEAVADDIAKFEAIFRATRVQVDRDNIDNSGG